MLDVYGTLYFVRDSGNTFSNIVYETLLGIGFASLCSDCVGGFVGYEVNLIVF